MPKFPPVSAVFEQDWFINVKDYGATGDGVTDDTAAIQAALDYAHNNVKLNVFFPQGQYLASTLTLYSGLSITGAYQGSFGLGAGGVGYPANYWGTMLQQIAGTNDHFLRFEAQHYADGTDRIGPFHMQGLILRGDGNGAAGDGLRFQDQAQLLAVDNVSAARPCVCQSMVILKDMMIRNFKGNGIWLPACHGGIFIENVNSFFNGGAGFFVDASWGILQALHFLNCDGDANLLDNIRIYKMGTTALSPRNYSTIFITGLRGERRVNPNPFAVGAIGSEHLVYCDTCNGGYISLQGATVCSVVNDLKPGDAVRIAGQTAGYAPEINFTQVALAIDNLRGQDVSPDPWPFIINDTVNARTVDRSVPQGNCGPNQFPSFSAHKNAVNQSVNSAINTKVTWSHLDWDTTGDFDLANNRWRPGMAGRYLITGAVSLVNPADGTDIIVKLRKNAGDHRCLVRMFPGAVGMPQGSGSCIVEANGTDYFELFVEHNHGAARDVRGEGLWTYFQGHRLLD